MSTQPRIPYWLASDPELQDQAQMSAPPVGMAAPPAAMAAPVNPHDTLTAPIGPPAPEPVPMMAAGKPGAAKAEKAPKMSANDQIEEHEQGRLMGDYQKDADPYGSADNHPGFFGKLLHGLNVATGGVNRRNWEEQGLQKNIQELEKEKSEEGLQGATQAHTEAETPEVAPNAESTREYQGAETRHANQETTNLQNPQDTNPDMATYRALIKIGMGPREALQEIERDKALALKPSEDATKTQDILGPDHKEHTMSWDAKTGKYDIDQGLKGEKPPIVNVNAANSALDRETTRFAKPYEKAVADANTQLDKIADARSMINGSAEAQALGVPKVLTALVSGAGSGVRITQPELNAIATARGLSGNIEGTLNSWAGQGKLTGTQKQQLTGILDDVKARILAKQQIHNEALDKINGASSREDVIQTEKDVRKRLSDLEQGGGGAKEGDTKVNGAGIKVKFAGGKWGPA